MFESLDDGRPTKLSRKSALVIYVIVSTVMLLATCFFLFICLHRVHPKPWIYAGLVVYPIGFAVSFWRLWKVWDLDRATPTESRSYSYFLCCLCCIPSIIHDLLM